MPTRPPSLECRKLGEARLAIARVAKTPDDWKRLWKKPAQPWAIKWGSCWKACFEYSVSDFAAECGFFIDILSFPTNAFGPDYAMFTSPDKDFYFAFVPTKDGDSPTPPGSIRLQFMVENIYALALDFEKRGVVFEKKPASHMGSPIYSATFRTPHGVAVDLWGMVDPQTKIRRRVDSTMPKVRAKVGAK